jgi:hypothetical protein
VKGPRVTVGKAAQAMGSDARELEAYLEEIRHEDMVGMDEGMRKNNRAIAKKHFDRLTPDQQKEYQSDYDTLVGSKAK